MPDEIKQELPPATLQSLLYMLATSAMINLGVMPDPTNQEQKANLDLAKHNIDTLGMLQNKTQGNLNPDESRLLEELLYDLRMKYVRATTKKDSK